MNSIWSASALGSLCTKIGSGATPRGGKESYKSEGIALIRSQNVYNNGFNPDGLAYIDEVQAAKLDNVAVQANDLLLNITGDSVARSCSMPESVLPARVNQHVAVVRPDPKKLVPGFLRYVLISGDMQQHLMQLAAAGATRNALTKGMIEQLQVPLPPLSEQQAIAELLGSLDDKIELNRKMNATLDDLARTIFRSWFVDFDPVRAKTEGREPFGMDAETAALFPDRFTDAELGPIPEGWTIDTIENLIVIAKESVSPSKAPDAEYAHYSIPAFDEARMPKIERGSEIKSNKTIVPEGAVLLSKLNPRIPRVWLSLSQTEHLAIASTEFIVLLPSQETNRSFVYGTISSDAFFDKFASLVSGTSGSHQRVRPKDFQSMRALVPDATLISAYDTAVNQMLRLIESNLVELRTLTQLRDTLLPELISGRIRVPEAERAAMEVV